MMFRHAPIASTLVLGALLLTMAGCGGHKVGIIDEPPESPSPKPSAAPSTAPGSGSVTPTPQPSQPDVPVIVGNLMARLQNAQVTGIFSKTQIATVEVTNPANGTLSGQLTCTFDGSHDNAVQTQNVSLMAHEVRTFTFEYSYKSYSLGLIKIADPKVDIRTVQPQSATGFAPAFTAPGNTAN